MNIISIIITRIIIRKTMTGIAIMVRKTTIIAFIYSLYFSSTS